MSLTRIPAVAAVLLALSAGPGGTAPEPTTRAVHIAYRAHDGRARDATILVPASYGPNDDPAIPLVISPHGRGVTGSQNARLWGNLPALGGFAVVNPDGEGSRVDGRFSWGAPGEIDDLARMPAIVREALPWLHIDRRRIYAVGGSMGGQETLLLVAQHPRLLAGAVAVDPMVDFARQYDNFPRLHCSAHCRRGWHGPVGLVLQAIARRELGGPPATAPVAYAARSPISYVRAIAMSCVPLELWWSRTDRIVMQSRLQSGRLAQRLRHLGIRGPFEEVVGSWRHTTVMRASTLLPAMLAGLQLMAAQDTPSFPSLHLTVHASGAPCGG